MAPPARSIKAEHGGGFRPEPATCRNHGLETLALFRIRAETDFVTLSSRGNDMNGQRIAVVEVPDLVRLQTVQGREVPLFQEKVDRGGE
jgi:hypothetical protein